MQGTEAVELSSRDSSRAQKNKLEDNRNIHSTACMIEGMLSAVRKIAVAAYRSCTVQAQGWTVNLQAHAIRLPAIVSEVICLGQQRDG